MRILVNMVTSSPDTLSGISVYAWNQLRALVAHGEAEYTLLTNWSREAVGAYLPLDKIGFIPAWSPRSEKLAVFVNAWTAWRTARRIGAAIIFTPHPLGALAGGRARVSVVHDLYRDTHAHLFRLDRRWTWKLLFPMCLAATHRVICVSSATQSDLSRYYPRSSARTAVVHEAPTIAVPGEDTAPLEGRYGLIVANAAPTKNLTSLITALDILKDDADVPPVVWVGRDDSGDMARARARHPGLSNFIEAGSKTEQELATLYRHAAFLVVPSLIEGFCLPVVEAHSYGVPVVCSDIPVLREVAGMGALYFDPDNPSSIADTLKAVCANADLHAELRTEASRNAERFSWSRAAEQIHALFSQTLREQGAGAPPQG